MSGIIRKKCPVCNNRMKRVYIRIRIDDKWLFKSIGWYCNGCNFIWGDENE